MLPRLQLLPKTILGQDFHCVGVSWRRVGRTAQHMGIEEAIATAEAGGFTPDSLADIHWWRRRFLTRGNDFHDEGTEVHTAYWKSMRQASILIDVADGVPDGNDVLSSVDLLAPCQLHDQVLVHRRDGHKVEGVEALGGREAGRLDPAVHHPVRATFPVSLPLDGDLPGQWRTGEPGRRSQRVIPCDADDGRRDQGRSGAGIQPRSSRQLGLTSANRPSPRPLMSMLDSPCSTRSLTALPVAGEMPNPWADAVTTT